MLKRPLVFELLTSLHHHQLTNRIWGGGYSQYPLSICFILKIIMIKDEWPSSFSSDHHHVMVNMIWREWYHYHFQMVVIWKWPSSLYSNHTTIFKFMWTHHSSIFSSDHNVLWCDHTMSSHSHHEANPLVRSYHIDTVLIIAASCWT